MTKRDKARALIALTGLFEAWNEFINARIDELDETRDEIHTNLVRRVIGDFAPRSLEILEEAFGDNLTEEDLDRFVELFSNPMLKLFQELSEPILESAFARTELEFNEYLESIYGKAGDDDSE